MTSNRHCDRRPILAHRCDWRHGLCLLAALWVTWGFGAASGLSAVPGQGATTPGARRATPGVGVRDRRAAETTVSYVGIMGAVKNRGVYSSPETGIPLADLVERAGGLTDGATQMAHVIRDGRAGLRVFFTPDTSETLLPGDVVVFQGGESGQPHLSGSSSRAASTGRRGTNAASPVPDTVHVAFVGLLDRRPVIVPLDGRYATVRHVVRNLRQSPAVAETVRVIRTDRRSRAGHTRGNDGRLADGDVLVFDRGLMNADALARTQTTAQTRFPDAIPMSEGPNVGPPADSLPGDQFEDQFLASAIDSPTRVRSASPASAANRVTSGEQEPDAGVRGNGSGAIATTNLPAGGVPAVASASSPAVSPENSPSEPPARAATDFSTGPDDVFIAGRATESDRGDGDLVSTFDLRAGDQAAARAANTGIGVSEIAGTAEVPFLDLAPSVDPPKLASLVDPSDLDIEEFLSKAASPHFEPAAELPLALPLAASVPVPSVPAPSDPSPATAESEQRRGSLAALGTPAIVIGVLALAAMCFAVSVAWTRVDRAAQTDAEPIHTSGDEVVSAPSRRQVLERLINNDLPMIEEPAQLPDRMDYHGEELGRRRLMLDDSHELMGPHFMAETEVAESNEASARSAVPKAGAPQVVASQTSSAPAAPPAPLSPPERARAALSRFMVASKDSSAGAPTSADLMRRDDPAEPADDSVPKKQISEQQTSGAEAANDGESSDRDTRQPAGLQPHSRLLERVLIAMERERRG